VTVSLPDLSAHVVEGSAVTVGATGTASGTVTEVAADVHPLFLAVTL
jgi:hypothetical protein